MQQSTVQHPNIHIKYSKISQQQCKNLQLFNILNIHTENIKNFENNHVSHFNVEMIVQQSFQC